MVELRLRSFAHYFTDTNGSQWVDAAPSVDFSPAFIVANAAFGAANTLGAQDNAVFTVANAAYSYANTLLPLSGGTLTGALIFNETAGGGSGQFWIGRGGYFGTSTTFAQYAPAGYGFEWGIANAAKMTMDSGGNIIMVANQQVGSLGVGTAASGTTGEIRAINNITGYYSSDITLKTNIVNIKNALSKVQMINGVEFDWTDEHIKDHGGEDGYFIRKHDVGVIAQEIEKVLQIGRAHV